jgi:ElaB/YqjD/DUF883 family membrane-anchored ribosome-binding protein
MMESTMNQSIEVTREKLLKDFNLVVADTEELLRSAAAAGGEKSSAWRAQVELNLKTAKDRLAQMEQAAKERLVHVEQAVVEKGKAAAHATDTYVHDNPWQAIGVTAGVSILAGLALGLLLNRDR